jgi:hypothetical protein
VTDENIATSVGERRLRRRGLIAGIGALSAAALLKLKGATPSAEAANGGAFVLGTLNTATTRTELRQDTTGEPTLAAFKNDTWYGNSDAIQGVTAVNYTSAIRGISDAATGGVGVIGTTFYGAGTGVFGTTTSPYVSQPAGAIGVGVFGLASQSRTAVKGEAASGIGVWGHSASGVGLKGTSASFVGLVGISDQNIGLYGYTVAPNVPAFYSENLAASGNRFAGLFNGNVTVQGNLTVTGAKSAAVKMPDGSEVLVYCQESPEPYFEDFGRSQLNGGMVHVGLDPQFASIVRLEAYMVFLTPAADTKGLYVARQDANGFEVRETQGGTGNVAFTYRIVAKRKDISGERLKKVDPQQAPRIADLQKQIREKVHATPPAEPPPVGNPQQRRENQQGSR